MNLLPQTLKITNFSFLVVGIVRNCDRSIIDDVLRLAHCLKNTKSIRWFVAESDSTDQTVEKLKYLGEKILNCEFTNFRNRKFSKPEPEKMTTHNVKHLKNGTRKNDHGPVLFVCTGKPFICAKW